MFYHKIIRKICVFGGIFLGANAIAQTSDFLDFIPKNYHFFDAITGDLNKDGKEDIVLIIKGMDRNAIVKNDFEKIVDRNRRGIIVLLKTENGYQKLVENRSCFSSENEDGGVYFAPELSAEIKKNSLFLNYGHGRWYYQFRISGDDMQLIGYERESLISGVLQNITSVNFLTQKKLYRENINKDDGDKKEILKDTWSAYPVKNPILLSKIEDFDELNFE